MATKLKIEHGQTLGELLRSSLWARGLTSEQLRRVTAEVIEQNVPAGRHLCRKGGAVDSWIGVIAGLVKLSSASPEGRSVTYTGVTSGGWFGEGSLLKSEPRRYDAVALRDTRIARMPREVFIWLIENSIPFNRFIVDQLNERLGQMIAMLDYDRLLDPDARVAHGLAALFNPQLYPGTNRDLQISQEEIGHLCGLSRQRVNRALQALERAGLLRTGFGRIAIGDPAKLLTFGAVPFPGTAAMQTDGPLRYGKREKSGG